MTIQSNLCFRNRYEPSDLHDNTVSINSTIVSIGSASYSIVQGLCPALPHTENNRPTPYGKPMRRVYACMYVQGGSACLLNVPVRGLRSGGPPDTGAC